VRKCALSVTRAFDSVFAVLWLGFIAYWIISAFDVKKTRTRATSWPRWSALILGAVLLLVSRTPFLRTFVFPRSLASDIVAVFLCVAGMSVAIWARRDLGRNWSATPTIRENHELITSGPYRFVRHPIYSGILLALLGTAIASGNVLWLVALALFLGLFAFRMRAEEQLMGSEFPDQYPSYVARTSALIPFIW